LKKDFNSLPKFSWLIRTHTFIESDNQLSDQLFLYMPDKGREL